MPSTGAPTLTLPLPLSAGQVVVSWSSNERAAVAIVRGDPARIRRRDCCFTGSPASIRRRANGSRADPSCCGGCIAIPMRSSRSRCSRRRLQVVGGRVIVRAGPRRRAALDRRCSTPGRISRPVRRPLLRGSRRPHRGPVRDRRSRTSRSGDFLLESRQRDTVWRGWSSGFAECYPASFQRLPIGRALVRSRDVVARDRARQCGNASLDPDRGDSGSACSTATNCRARATQRPRPIAEATDRCGVAGRSLVRRTGDRSRGGIRDAAGRTADVPRVCSSAIWPDAVIALRVRRLFPSVFMAMERAGVRSSGNVRRRWPSRDQARSPERSRGRVDRAAPVSGRAGIDAQCGSARSVSL